MRGLLVRVLVAAALVGTVVAANYATAHLGMIEAGFGLAVSAGTYAAGLALALRDALDRLGGLRWVLPTILGGIAASAILAGPTLALASAVAFGLSELADLGAWRAVRRRSVVAAIVASNAVGALVDTFAFLPLAGFPLTAEAVGGQLLVKAGYISLAAVAAVVIVRSRAVRA